MLELKKKENRKKKQHPNSNDGDFLPLFQIMIWKILVVYSEMKAVADEVIAGPMKETKYLKKSLLKDQHMCRIHFL